MSNLSEIVNITISRQTKVPSQAGLGFAAFVSASADFAETIKAYADIDEVTADEDVGADSLDFATDYFGQNPRPTRLYVIKKGAGTYVEALNAAILVNNDWYGVAIASRTKADILLVAAWTESRVKIFGACSAEAGVLVPGTTDDVASTLQDSSYERTFYIWHSQAATCFPEGALMGAQFPKIAGASTYVYKTLAGIPVDNLTTTQENSALAKNASVYVNIGGINMTEGGKVMSGEWIDVITGIDDLVIDQRSRVFGKLVNSEKVDFTNAGITKIVGAVRESLRRSVNNSVLAEDPAFTVTAPLASEVSAQNKGNRTLPDVKWQATLAGAIQKVLIAGTIVL